jgi:GntR family transcriptional regulator/MocR family aminotransferase
MTWPPPAPDGWAPGSRAACGELIRRGGLISGTGLPRRGRSLRLCRAAWWSPRTPVARRGFLDARQGAGTWVGRGIGRHPARALDDGTGGPSRPADLRGLPTEPVAGRLSPGVEFYELGRPRLRRPRETCPLRTELTGHLNRPGAPSPMRRHADRQRGWPRGWLCWRTSCWPRQGRCGGGGSGQPGARDCWPGAAWRWWASRWTVPAWRWPGSAPPSDSKPSSSPRRTSIRPGGAGAERRSLDRSRRRHDLVLIEDDYDGSFRFDRERWDACRGLAPDVTVLVGSVSKTSLRALGWLAGRSRGAARRLADRGQSPVSPDRRSTNWRSPG